QMNDHKSSVQPAELKGNPLLEYGKVCAELLAKGHARSGDPALLADYLGRPGKAEKGLLQYALSYADQVEKDYEEFLKALKRSLLNDAMKIADHRIFWLDKPMDFFRREKILKGQARDANSQQRIM